MKKGFRKQAVPTKSEIMEYQTQTIEGLKQHSQFLGQQVYQLMQQSFQQKREFEALTSLIRAKEVNRPVQKGDHILIDFIGKLINEDGSTGEVFPGGEGLGYLVQNLGSGNLVAGIEDNLVGVVVNQDVTVDITFPADYHAKELQSKKARFSIEILKVFENITSAPQTEMNALRKEREEKAKTEAAKKAEEAKTKTELKAVEEPTTK